MIALVPLAAFELATGLPAATQVLQRVRRSLGRTLHVLHTDPLVVEPASAVPLPRSPHTLRVRGLRCRYGDEGPWALDGVDLDSRPGGG